MGRLMTREITARVNGRWIDTQPRYRLFAVRPDDTGAEPVMWFLRAIRWTEDGPALVFTIYVQEAREFYARPEELAKQFDLQIESEVL